jgi:hypothetical protein
MSMNITRERGMRCKTAKHLRHSLTASLTAVFFLISAAALAGWFKPLLDERWAVRAESIAILAIGYYFGRLPARRTEEAFGEALARHAQKADAAQHAKELAQQAGEVLEERMKNARMILAAARQARGRPSRPGSESAQAAPGEEALRQSVAAALSILDS